MEEIISSILSAESKAEEIIKIAQEESKKLIFEAEREADTVITKAISDFKTYKKVKIKEAEALSEKVYDEKLLLGKKEAEKVIIDNSEKISSIADYIVKEILE